MGRKINKNSKRQLKLQIKKLNSDNDILGNMVNRRNKELKKNNIPIGVDGDEFLMGDDELI